MHTAGAKVIKLHIRLRIEAVRNVSSALSSPSSQNIMFPWPLPLAVTLYVSRALGNNISARWHTVRAYLPHSVGRIMYAAGQPAHYGQCPNAQCCREACENTISNATSSRDSILPERIKTGQPVYYIHVSKDPNPFRTRAALVGTRCTTHMPIS